MSVLDRLVRAETSSDLLHSPEPCAVDVPIAAGLVGIAAPIHQYAHVRVRAWDTGGALTDK